MRLVDLLDRVLDLLDASILGEPGAGLSVADGAIRLRMGAAEIRTVQLRRRERGTGHPPFPGDGGPRRLPEVAV